MTPTLTMSASATELKRALKSWRRETYEKSPSKNSEFFGEQLLMDDFLLDRIVGLALQRKVPTVSALASQVKYVYIRRYGEQIVEIIQRHCPQNVELSSSFPIMN
ncbi:hypothetical protein Agabi119p4_7622 [Agaricus bisporus var. burnettii]|uniref:Uncharacterized protein n=1 Tax=Agaricus bisporus var. burnettii TaxID=192524 RepID=A0A8H7EZ42_AGABI|nr:hypothetical protein Agabi119p4_7622 [Agaricus bisporus var. burnettii]